MSRNGVWILSAVLTCAAASTAWATIDNLKSYKAAYPEQDPKSVSCKTCHAGAIGKKGDLNAYGQALQQFKAPEPAKKLTVDDYRAFEQADLDKDGATNLQELQAGTSLTDPASVPPAADAATPAAASSEPPAAESAP